MNNFIQKTNIQTFKEKCDCLNYCGDDKRLNDNKATPCEEMAKRIHLREVVVYDAQQLVHAQIEVNRAVFLMNARDNPEIHKHLDSESLDKKNVLRHIRLAINHLNKACYE